MNQQNIPRTDQELITALRAMARDTWIGDSKFRATLATLAADAVERLLANDAHMQVGISVIYEKLDDLRQQLRREKG